MPCSCKETRSDAADSFFSDAQLQYVVDLTNRRNDGAAPTCKTGKLCNGRCIPKNHVCRPAGGLRSSQTSEQPAQEQSQEKPPKKGLSLGAKVGLGTVAAYAGLNLYAHHELSKMAAAEQADDEEFAKHVNSDPQRKADYEKAKAAGRAQGGKAGEQYVHQNAKHNWRTQAGVPDPNAPKDDRWHETLGVKKNASPEEVKAAYRKLSLEHHPDKSKDPDAAAKFEKVNAAYKASKARKDSLKWQTIEQAYCTAQQRHPRVDAAFWRL